MPKQKTKNNPQPKKQTAAQRLQILENTLTNYDSKFEILADEIDKVSNLMVTLNKKVNAVLEAGDKGDINKQAVSNILVDNAVAELKQKVDNLVQAKVATKVEDGTIEGPRFFVVGRELDADGNVVNPRTQFALMTLAEDIQKKFLNHKVGDIIEFDGVDTSMEIIEIYKLADFEKEVDMKDVAEQEEAEETKQ